MRATKSRIAHTFSAEYFNTSGIRSANVGMGMWLPYQALALK